MAIKDHLLKMTLPKFSHGPFSESDDGWVANRPYVTVDSDGYFEGYDTTGWMYSKFPEDLSLHYLRDPMEVVYRQLGFVDICNHFGNDLNAQIERTKNDIRRDFHILVTAGDGYPRPYQDAPPMHEDYLQRMFSQFGSRRVEYHGYMGLRLLPMNIFSDSYGLKEKFKRWVELNRGSGAGVRHVYRRDIETVQSILSERGFKTLDFQKDLQDYEQLTSWHGQGDLFYEMERTLETTRWQQPAHGLTVVLPKFGEVTWLAVKPRERGMFQVNPMSSSARWGQSLLDPTAGVAAVSIRGQIRASKVAEALVELRGNKAIKQGEGKQGESIASMTEEQMALYQSQKAVDLFGSGTPLLDNVEILVAVSVSSGSDNVTLLNNSLVGHGLQAVPLVGRQATAMVSTLPTSSIRVARVKKNVTDPVANKMLPGVIAMSGIMRHRAPADSRGFVVGLVDEAHQYSVVYTDPEAPFNDNAPPGMLITGRPGAGKTMSMLQQGAQAYYTGMKWFYLDPKKKDSLKPFFDNLGAHTITFNNKFLSRNPGGLDPMFFLDDREEVAKMLAGAIMQMAQMYDERGTAIARLRTKLAAELNDRARDTRNECSHHIIFGNGKTGNLKTEGVTVEGIQDMVRDRIKVSHFWKALIAAQPMDSNTLSMFRKGNNPVLVEWDGELKLPDINQTTARTDEQIDSLLSVSTVFQYAAAVLNDKGGLLQIDEGWALKQSPEAMAILSKGGREWRQSRIMLTIGTQRILDFLEQSGGEKGGAVVSMASAFSRFLFMAISEGDVDDLQEFFARTGLKKDDPFVDYSNYIQHASDKDNLKRGQPPRGLYMDTINGWMGGVICGPWPRKELAYARTDAKAKEGLKEYEATHAERTTTDEGIVIPTLDEIMEHTNTNFSGIGGVTGNDQ